ncbi:hypothetical protein E3N88_23659 [Mikania micrantha]|uniref:Uncharacterized protein n=1 Tax=Mikania micrantha TaxID=192012 RepID=A0A5N6NGJ7_9ASTR|nr:hypothetical protein E3N88_23659 [Mikania micrantha]
MAPKRGRPAKKAAKNITNPEPNQIPPVNVESNPDPHVNPEANVVPPGNLETNTTPPVNPGAGIVPPAGTSGSETNEAMIARIVREQLSACGVLTQQHNTSGSGGNHVEQNVTGGHPETHQTTGTTTTVPDPPRQGCL